MQYNKQVKLIMNIFQNYQNLIFLKVQLNHYYHLKSILFYLLVIIMILNNIKECMKKRKDIKK